jgi:hypothetical protein
MSGWKSISSSAVRAVSIGVIYILYHRVFDRTG